MGINHIFLSHPISENTPGFGGENCFKSESIRSIARGDTSNSSRWTLHNHLGTHVDAPLHFLDQGRSIDCYAADFWHFDRVHVIAMRANDDELIDGRKWRQEIPQNCELLLLKTGFESWRSSSRYWQRNPGLSPDLCAWLKAERSSLRALGFDFISLTAFGHRDQGRLAHRILLDEKTEPAIVIIEDMKLSSLNKKPNKVIVSPFRVEKSDGAPATVFAELDV